MRKLILLLIASIITATSMAVPARRGVVRTITLADGTSVRVELRGDENFHFYVNTATGQPMSEQADGTWTVDTRDVHHLWSQAASQRHADRARLAEHTRRLMTQLRDQRRRAPQRVGESSVGTGMKRGLLILVNFKGTNEKFKPTSTVGVFEQMMNGLDNPYGRNYGSVREYFRAQSYGLLDIVFDVVGPVTVSQQMSYYGTDYNGQGNDHYAYKMVEEACKLVDSQINFADYDWDGDGEVENIYVTYAGYGQASGAPASTIWPHQWSISAGHYYYDTDQGHTNYTLKLDDVVVDTYACGPELNGTSGSTISGIGTMCHEYSHCLGLPDFYDTSGSNFGMADWSLMDYGCYNGNGFHPAGYTAYERWFSGWLEPKELKSPYFVSQLKPIEDEPDAYIVYNDGNRNEYYLLSNHQQKGWDGKAYGHGMMVNHVFYDRTVWAYNEVNTTKNTGSGNTYQRMTIIPADNTANSSYGADAGDLYPGSSGNNQLTNTSTPSASLYAKNTDGKNLMNKPITEIAEADGIISFSFMGGQVTIDTPVATDATAIAHNTFTANWDPVEGAVSYNLTLTETIDDGQETPSAVDLMVLYEDFKKFLVESDGSVNISSRLDEYTFQPGWTGSSVFQGQYGAKLASKNNAGSLTTPSLDFTSGSMTILTYVRAYDSSATPTLSILDGSGSTIASGTITPSDSTYLIFTLDDGVPDVAKLKISTPSRKRVYVGDLYVFDGILDNDQLSQFITDELANVNVNKNNSSSVIHRSSLNKLSSPRTLTPQPSSLIRIASTMQSPRRIKTTTTRVIEGIEATSYVLTDCQPESVYTYMVQAVDADGNVSLWGNKITVTTLAAPSLDKGDINGDGIITIADVTALVNIILGNEDENENIIAVADMNGDNAITIADVTELVNYILGK